MRPDDDATELFGYWLARALRRFPGIELISVIHLSNHAHLVLEDRTSDLSDFMCYFLGQLASDLNVVRGRRGPLFERRFSAEPILDDAALASRIEYVLLNPVRPGLVANHKDWPGLIAWSGDGKGPRTFRRFDRREFNRAVRDAKPDELVVREDFVQQETLELAPLPAGVDADEIAATVADAEAEYAKQRKGGVIGAHRLKKQDPYDKPARPKRSRRPLCHASTRELWDAFKDKWYALCAAYDAASVAWRGGDTKAIFPAYTFKPHVFAPG